MVGIDPKLSDAELVTLAFMQAPYWVSPPRPAGRAHVGLPPTRNGRVDLDRLANMTGHQPGRLSRARYPRWAVPFVAMGGGSTAK